MAFLLRHLIGAAHPLIVISLTGASERPSADVLAGASSNAAFLVTIDTEGDNLWAAPVEATTENARCLPRFQALCERHGFKPTYLTDHEMALCDRFVEFARDGLGRLLSQKCNCG